jgi:hypothetical protein
MVNAINDELIVILGESGASALGYYADPELVGEDAAEYEKRLNQVLGSGARLVCLRLRDRACRLAGRRPKPECAGIANCLACVAASAGVFE